MSALLEAKNITVELGGKRVLEDASLSIAAGERVALVGPNGAGKTTLVRALAGLQTHSGSVTIEGVAAHDRRARARALAYLPQGHVAYWPLPVRDIVALGRLPHGGMGDVLSPQDQQKTMHALSALGLDDFADRPVTELSGGERARVALARALAVEARLILADEPVASLDPKHQLAVIDALVRESQRGVGVVAVLHDLSLAARFASRIVLMGQGRIIADGPVEDVLTAAHLEAVFGVRFLIEAREDGRIILPWA